MKKIYLDTIVFTPQQLEALVKLFGVEKILLGTDYPYDMGEYDPIGHIASVASFSEADRAAIAGGNAKALFGFQGPGRWQRGSPTLMTPAVRRSATTRSGSR